MTVTSLAALHRTAPLLMALTLLLVCSGCIVGPDSCRPNTPVPDTWHQQLENGDYVGSAELDYWWSTLNDPILDELINSADDGNVDLYAALMRIRQARTQVCIARSARLAMVDQVSSFRNQKLSPNAINFPIFGTVFDFWDTRTELSWEPDLFGRVQRTIDSAWATTEAAVEAYRDVMVLLYSEVAANYVRVRTTQEQLEYARRNVALQEKALELATKRVDAGVAPILDQHQAELNLATTESEIPPLEQQLQLDLNRLAVLLGQYPGTLHEYLAEPQPIPVPSTIPEKVPCDLVRQRPDIRQAERLLAARCADLGVALADLFPRFAINGSFGLRSQKLSNLWTADSWAHEVGPSVSWPIFQGFRIKCNIAAADAAVEEAIATYEQTILLAVEEVEDSIVSFNKERERYAALERTVEASERTLESVLATYRAGKTDFLNVVATLQSLATAQNALAVSEGQVVQNLISIYQSLGGGWDPQHHCYDRCVRVRCPQRADPSIVEVELKDDPSDRYFGQTDQGEDEEVDEATDADDQPELGPETQADQADELEPLESLLQRKVQELEERLREPPGRDPPPSEQPLEPGAADALDELLQPSDPDGARLTPRDYWR